jgi:hypothetical protein
MPLFRPEEYLVLNYGGRLKAATGADGSTVDFVA